MRPAVSIGAKNWRENWHNTRAGAKNWVDHLDRIIQPYKEKKTILPYGWCKY